MKKIVDDERLIYKVCCLYYNDNMNQMEIGDYLGVSRSSVMRMLQKGREMGIVTIEIHNPFTYDYGEMEKKIENYYGLKDVVVVEDSVLDSKTEAASYLFGRRRIISIMSLTKVTRSASLWDRHSITWLPPIKRTISSRTSCSFPL